MCTFCFAYRYVWGVQPRRCHFQTLPAVRALTENPPPMISRAQFKMSELCETVPILLDSKKPYVVGYLRCYMIIFRGYRWRGEVSEIFRGASQAAAIYYF